MIPQPKDNPQAFGLLTAVSLMLVLYLGVLSWNAVATHDTIGQEPHGRDVITIDGEGKVSGTPTLAEVSLGLYSEGMDVPQVQSDNNAKVNGIIDAMKVLGIAEADLQTSQYNISPKYDYTDGLQRVVGYTVSQSVTVKVRDLTKVGTVLSRAGQLGANQVNGLNFTIDDPTQLQQEARKEALEDARMKAKELADAMGVRLVKVVTFSESSGTPGPIPLAYRAFDKELASAPIVPDVQPGQLDVTSRISVTFEIR